MVLCRAEPDSGNSGSGVAYLPDGHHPLLYGAAADGPSMETIIRNTFAAATERADGTLVFRELVPTVPGMPPVSARST
jgi:hypothetical protein